ncbi:MAG: PIN domain-containing protein [Lachnospiraceae bacterium]|nr:PIN domain-containing protein [Lachnospiraceae bacterium]
MQNMVLLIDTNVLLNYITNREDQYLEQSVKIVELCARSEYNGYIAFHTLSILWYVLRKWSNSERRNVLKDICEIFTVASAAQKEILDAIEKDSFPDFEDCLQDKCAKDIGADYIITCNENDFTHSEIPAINPSAFLHKFR